MCSPCYHMDEKIGHKHNSKKINAFEMWCYWRMLRISTTIDVIKKMGVNETTQ